MARAARGSAEPNPRRTSARDSLSATTAVQASVARAAEARARQLELAEQLATVRSSKLALCERVDALRGEALIDELAAARGEWEGLPSGPEPDEADAELLDRFEEACRRATERHENRQETERVNSRLDAAVDRGGAARGAGGQPGVRVGRCRSASGTISRSGATGSTKRSVSASPPPMRPSRERAEAKRAAAEKALRQQVQRLDQLIERATKRATAEDLTLREADKAARDLRAGARDAAGAAARRARDAGRAAARPRSQRLAPKLHELREMDEWKRFANAAVQEELIAQTEALRDEVRPREARGSREGRRASCTRSRNAGSRPPKRRARRRRRCGTAIARPPTRSRPRRASSSRSAPRSGRATWRRSSRSASAPRRWPTRPTGSRPPRS